MKGLSQKALPCSLQLYLQQPRYKNNLMDTDDG